MNIKSLLPVGIGFVGGVLAGYVLFSSPATAPDTAKATSTAPALDVPSGPVIGHDVSHFQGEIDFAALANSDVDFLYAKASEGRNTGDAQYSANRAGAQSVGLPFGSYHFYVTTEDPQSQVAHFLSVIGNISGQLPPVVDVETAPGNGIDLAADVKTFMETVKSETGCAPLLYSNKSTWSDYLKLDTDQYPLWLAEYSQTIKLPDGAKDWVFWQHSDKSTAPGITGDVDADVFNGTHQDLISLLCP